MNENFEIFDGADVRINPVARYLHFHGNKGTFSYKDEESGNFVELNYPFSFVALNDQTFRVSSGSTAERKVKSTTAHNNNPNIKIYYDDNKSVIAEGNYYQLTEQVKAVKGRKTQFLYIAARQGDTYVINRVSLHGLALAAWVDFKKKNPYVGATPELLVTVTGTYNKEGKKGTGEKPVPIFEAKRIPSNEVIKSLFAEVKSYVDGVLQSGGDNFEPTEDVDDNSAPPATSSAGFFPSEKDVPPAKDDEEKPEDDLPF